MKLKEYVDAHGVDALSGREFTNHGDYDLVGVNIVTTVAGSIVYHSVAMICVKHPTNSIDSISRFIGMFGNLDLNDGIPDQFYLDVPI